MPYIGKESRKILDKHIDKIIKLTKGKHGALNYIFNRLIIETQPLSYEDYESLIGLFVCSMLEYWRKQVVPYEDRKARENGDIFPSRENP